MPSKYKEKWLEEIFFLAGGFLLQKNACSKVQWQQKVGIKCFEPEAVFYCEGTLK
jgi:hypothetical protein